MWGILAPPQNNFQGLLRSAAFVSMTAIGIGPSRATSCNRVETWPNPQPRNSHSPEHPAATTSAQPCALSNSRNTLQPVIPPSHPDCRRVNVSSKSPDTARQSRCSTPAPSSSSDIDSSSALAQFASCITNFFKATFGRTEFEQLCEAYEFTRPS